MVEITSKLATGQEAEADASIELAFELRQKSRLRARLSTGEEASLQLHRGEVLRGGDLLATNDGRIVQVIARAEQLLHIECDTPHALARAAYHLGNRHVPVQVGDGYLRIAADHVLERMLEGLGGRVTALTAPFEPEAGAYTGHTHAAPDHAHFGAARIHEYVPIGRAAAGSGRKSP